MTTSTMGRKSGRFSSTERFAVHANVKAKLLMVAVVWAFLYGTVRYLSLREGWR